MEWASALENPSALQLLNVAPSALTEIILHEVVLNHDGPLLRLRFDVLLVPVRPPARWPLDTNITQITLAAWGIERLTIKGWDTTVLGSLTISVDGTSRTLHFNGGACEIQAGLGWLRVEKVQGYVQNTDG